MKWDKPLAYVNVMWDMTPYFPAVERRFVGCTIFTLIVINITKNGGTRAGLADALTLKMDIVSSCESQ
jgi:hypothetical protein